MGMEIHAAMTVLHTLNTNHIFYIDLNNHLIFFLHFAFRLARLYIVTN